MIVFKIRRISDGLFSTGGYNPSFTKRGKIWKQKGHLTSHLTQASNETKNLYLGTCEIVPYELVEQPSGPSISIGQYMLEVANRKNKRIADAKAIKDKYQKEERRKAYEALKAEFERND